MKVKIDTAGPVQSFHQLGPAADSSAGSGGCKHQIGPSIDKAGVEQILQSWRDWNNVSPTLLHELRRQVDLRSRSINHSPSQACTLPSPAPSQDIEANEPAKYCTRRGRVPHLYDLVIGQSSAMLGLGDLIGSGSPLLPEAGKRVGIDHLCLDDTPRKEGSAARTEVFGGAFLARPLKFLDDGSQIRAG
nr:hypothetical protein [Microvirga calopogonii]